MNSPQADGHSPAGFPHSEISGSKPVSDSPELIAAFHVLLRLWLPRHPPYALCSLTLSLRHASSSHTGFDLRVTLSELLLEGRSLLLRFLSKRRLTSGLLCSSRHSYLGRIRPIENHPPRLVRLIRETNFGPSSDSSCYSVFNVLAG